MTCGNDNMLDMLHKILLKLVSLVSFYFLKLEDFKLHTWSASYFSWTAWIYSVNKCNFLP